MSYTTVKALSITKKVELIMKYEFIEVAVNTNSNIFII